METDRLHSHLARADDRELSAQGIAATVVAKGVNPDHVRKLRQILLVMQAAERIEALNVPTFRLHPLTGGLKGFWSVAVRANWRVIFRFEDGKAFDIDLVDYH